MRIAFDVDDTLVPREEHFDTESSFLARLLSPFFPERVRMGTRQLFRALRSQGHEIWIYTSSVRDPLYLKVWFLLLGVRIKGVVNHEVHTNAMRRKPAAVRDATKYPPAFGIDLMVDHSWGVVAEGEIFDYPVVRVDPGDLDWVDYVLAAVRTKASRESTAS